MRITSFGITENIPGIGNKLFATLALAAIEIAVESVDKFAMVYPDMRCAIVRDKIVSTYVHTAGALENKVAEDDVFVAGVDGKKARITIGFGIVARDVDNELTRFQFALFVHGGAIAQRAAGAGRGAVSIEISIDELLLQFGRHIPFRTKSGAIDTDDAFVG